MAVSIISHLMIFVTLPSALADNGFYPPEGADISERLPLYLSLSITDIQSKDNRSELMVTLFEKDMKTVIPQVVYDIELADYASNTTITRSVFYAENGTAIIRLVNSSDYGSSRLIGSHEQFLNAWVADGSLALYSPLIGEGAVYEITIRILGIDTIRELLAEEYVPELKFLVDTGQRNVTAQAVVVPEFQQSVLISSGFILFGIIILYRLRIRT